MVKTKPPELELCFDDKDAPWSVYNDPGIRQVDGYNCGPIACLKVMEIYGIIPKNSVEEASVMHAQGYHGIVMEYYNRFMKRYEPDIWYNVSGARSKKIAKEMEHKEEEDDQSTPNHSVAKAHLIHSSESCNIAMEKKNKRQEEKANQALKQCGDAAVKSGVSPGAVVTRKVDGRTYYNPEGLVAIVYQINPRTGGLRTCCEHGVITHDGSVGVYDVPFDRYSIKAPAGTFVPLPEKLAEVRKKVEDGLFNAKKAPRISYSKVHQGQIHANSPVTKARGCGCKRGECMANCGCRRNKLSCHSGCTCNGNCGG